MSMNRNRRIIDVDSSEAEERGERPAEGDEDAVDVDEGEQAEEVDAVEEADDAEEVDDDQIVDEVDEIDETDTVPGEDGGDPEVGPDEERVVPEDEDLDTDVVPDEERVVPVEEQLTDEEVVPEAATHEEVVDEDAIPEAAASEEVDEDRSTVAALDEEVEYVDELPPPSEPEPAPATAASTARRLEPEGPLLTNADSYRGRWNTIQSGFVDEPMYAVESAGRLLAEVLGELASTFATKRNELEAQWRHGGDTSTEELRLAFQAYRSFFNRVVSV